LPQGIRKSVRSCSSNDIWGSEIKKSDLFYLTVIDKPVVKRFVQENANRKEHHKHNHEKHEKELTPERPVSREELDQL